MRLICPNCDAQYEVDDGAIPRGGRDVQCSNCGHAWFQLNAEALEAAEDRIVEVTPPAQVVPEPSRTGTPGPKAPPAAPPAPMATHEPEPKGVAASPPVQEPAEPVAAETETPPHSADAPAAPVRRTLDENLLAVLREEAAREAAERRAEAARAIEIQPDLGPLDAGVRPPPVVENLSSEEPDHPITQRPGARRDLLPDIEEINSTLRPGSEARDDDDVLPMPPAPKRAAFRTGFFSVILAALVLVILYAMAPQLADRFPQAAAVLDSYVVTVDGLRVWLDGVMKAAAEGLQSLTGEG